MPEFEFRFLCKDKEACKRVRFGNATGIYPKPLNDDRRNILGTPFVDEPKNTGVYDPNCNHEIPMRYHYEMASNPEYSIELNCKNCESLLTMVPTTKRIGDGPYKNRTLFALVDFVNYDRKHTLKDAMKHLVRNIVK